MSKRQLITRAGADVYLVPGSGQKFYRVRYGADAEECSCTDFSIHRGEIPCKHLQCVALMHATRRHRVPRCVVCGTLATERTLVGRRLDGRRDGDRWCIRYHPESLAGDPFVAAEK